MTDFKVVIPARFASERLPGKPVRLLAGRTMLEYVWRIARDSGASEILVATDHKKIVDAATSIGADVLMTDPKHPSGSDRIAEVAVHKNWPADTIIVNVQCDEPLLPPSLIRQVANLLESGGDIATLATPVSTVDEVADPNVVKVVVDKNSQAMYFSRAAIPCHRSETIEPSDLLRHIGLYAYRVHALKDLCAMAPCRLEQIERLEQLRALWAGMAIRVGIAVEKPGPGVDTADDVISVEKILARN